MREGTINVTNDGTILDVNANCSLIVDPGASKQVLFTGNVDIKNKIRINDATGVVDVQSGEFDHGGFVQNLGGKYILQACTSAYHLSESDGVYAFDQSSGTTILWGNSKLWAGQDSSIRIAGGKLVTVAETDGDTAIIKVGGALVVTGGEVLIARDSTDPNTHHQYNFGVLKVEGNVEWRGGTYRPYVLYEGGESETGDLWWATGTFFVGDPNVAPVLADPIAVNYEGSVVTPTTGSEWKVLKGDGGITWDDLAPAGSLDWAIDEVHNPITEWWMRKK